MAWGRGTRGGSLFGKTRGVITPSLRLTANDKYVFETFNQKPTTATKSDHATAATATDGDENILRTDRNMFEYHFIGDQTAVEPTWDANGLDFGINLTDNEGLEFTSGGIIERGRNIFTVGTDPAFFLSVTLEITDVSGTDDCLVGFRLVEAYQSAVDDYDELAALNVIQGAITIETILNDATAVSTDTTNTWANTATKTLTVRVSEAGVVTYQIDGAAPTVTAAFTFDDADVLTPFFYFLHGDHFAETTYLQKWECGYQTALGGLAS